MQKKMDIKEISALLSCSSKKLYSEIEKGNLKAVKTGRKYEITLDDFHDYINYLRFQSKGNNLRDQIDFEKVEVNKEIFEDKYKKRSTRRSFMKSSLSIFGTIMMMGSGSFLGRAAYTKYEEYRKAKLSKSLKSFPNNPIFLGLNDFFVSAGTNHMKNFYGNYPFHSSSNIKAAIGFDSHIQSIHNDSRKSYVEFDRCEDISMSNSDIVCFGSPISDPISKIALEYSGVDYHLQRNSNNILDLPFEYIMDKENAIVRQGSVKKILNNNIVSTPNWFINSSGKEAIIPKLDSRGFIIKDYLLISKIPNTTSIDSFASGRDIWVVGGTHGVGTEAINLILNQPQVYASINESIRKFPYYQILHEIDVEVRCVKGEHIMAPVHVSRVRIEEVRVNINNMKF